MNRKSPCGWYANNKGCGPADINVWVQAPSYILTALAEVGTSITTMEYAYSKAPENMRSLLQACGLFMTGIASAIGFGLVGLSEVS